MSKLKQQAKIERVMRFLMSFSRRDVSTRMALRGFSAEDREEGFALVDKAVGRNLSLKLGVFEPDQDLVVAVDAWENVWFDVASAALRRNFPKVHARVFHNLSKTAGPLVLPNVKVFLDRLDALEGGDKADKAALALLAKRGLGDKQRQYVADLLASARSEVLDDPEIDDADELVQLDEAIDEMWSWYLDWAMTARTVVKSKRLRIIMGLSSPNSPARASAAKEGEVEGEEVELEEVEDDEDGEDGEDGEVEG